MKNFDYYYNELEKHIANYNLIDKSKIEISISVNDAALQIQTCLDCISYYAKACMTCNRYKDKFSENQIVEIIGKIWFTSEKYTIARLKKTRKIPEMSETLKQLINCIRNIKLDYYFK